MNLQACLKTYLRSTLPLYVPSACLLLFSIRAVSGASASSSRGCLISTKNRSQCFFFKTERSTTVVQAIKLLHVIVVRYICVAHLLKDSCIDCFRFVVLLMSRDERHPGKREILRSPTDDEHWSEPGS